MIDYIIAKQSPKNKNQVKTFVHYIYGFFIHYFAASL